MITLFLNGGIAEHESHPTLAGLAARALALVPHPVPALPSTEFVHGDFTIANEATFRACLAHRVLAILLAASECPSRFAAATERARLLLGLVD